jgi:hypothetical protein
VEDTDPEHLRIHERKIVPLLVQAVKDLAAELDAVKKELATLKAGG